VNAAEFVPSVQRSAFSVQESLLRNRYSLCVLGGVIEVDSPLAGEHQRRNIALAIAAAVEISNCHGFRITPAQIAEGIRQTQWPGRLERMQVAGRADVLLDVAHNPAGAWALRAALSSLGYAESAHGTRVLVFGCMKDKAYQEMAQIVFPLFDLVIATPVESPRSASSEEIVAAAAKTGVRAVAARDGQEALERAWAEAPQEGLVVVAGSVYLVGEVRPLLERVAVETR
jgi:dihydrofolate synthase/folylpolyglutamate synthase